MVSELQRKQMPVTYLRIALRDFLLDENDHRAMLAGTGLTLSRLRQSDAYISLATMRDLLQNLSIRLRAPGWHLGLASHLSFTSHGPLGVAAATAPDLRTAIDVLLRYTEIRAPYVWLTGEPGTDTFIIRAVEAVDLGPVRQLLVETMFLAIQSIVAGILGRNLAGAQLELAYSAPPYDAALRRAFDGDLKFDGEGHYLRLPASWLDESCALFDDQLHRAATSRCRELLRRVTGESDIEVAVRAELLAARGKMPKLDVVARSQHISPRTLIRRLKRAGTSYQKILVDVHRALAVDLLLHSELQVAEIAYRLGFGDPANFNRAFRGWTGEAPGRFRSRDRRRLAASGPRK